MKHSIKITVILIILYLIAQLIGIAVTNSYSHKFQIDKNGSIENITDYDLPYNLSPDPEMEPKDNFISIIISLIIAILLILLLMTIRAELFLRIWFFAVIIFALSISLNSIFKIWEYPILLSLIIAIPLAIVKVFKRNIIVHNLTELLIYPGIAIIFVPLLSIFWAVLFLVVISLYDIYAVWHAGFMQKMAKFQIENVKVFSGFFIPYLAKKDIEKIKNAKNNQKSKKVKVNVAILGGGDIVLPIILSGVVLNVFGVLAAIIIALGATLALSFLFFMSEKGKFYPAMPFISAGCFLALSLVYLLF